MTDDNLSISAKLRTKSIVALNFASSLSQFSQFGLGTTLLPIALAAKYAPPETIGLTSSFFWIGMLTGLLVASQLTRWFGYRNTVIIGLVLTAASFLSIPLINWHFWALPSAAIGFGMGLRWIALETWLYRLASQDTRGRIVGVHETLLAISAVAGPLTIVIFGASKPTVFWIAAVIMLIAIIPLIVVVNLSAVTKLKKVKLRSIALISLSQKEKFQFLKHTIYKKFNHVLLFWFGSGAIIAGLGGLIEGSLLSLLPVYMTDIGKNAADAAWLITLLEIGAMIFQYPIGWLADHKTVLWTANLCAFITGFSVVLILCFGASLFVLQISIFLLGGSTAGLLTLGIIWAAQDSKGSTLTDRMRQVSIVYTTFSATGPFLESLIVSHTSISSLFWQQLFVTCLLFWVLFNLATPRAIVIRASNQT